MPRVRHEIFWAKALQPPNFYTNKINFMSNLVMNVELCDKNKMDIFRRIPYYHFHVKNLYNKKMHRSATLGD